MNTLELILHDDVRTLLDHFASVLDVHVVFLSADGGTVLRGRDCGNCAYCELFQEHAGGVARCIALDRTQCEACRKSGGIVQYRCHAGLHEAVAPIVRNGVLLGFVMIGQFRTGRGLPDELDCLSDREVRREAEKQYHKLPLIPQEKLPGVLGLFQLLIGYIGARELVATRSEPVTTPARRFIQRHFKKPIRLADAARAACCSASKLSHALAEEHSSFMELLIETRLHHAETLWRQNPALPIGEAAQASGFADRYYFSRIYRKKRGRTPGDFRRSC